MPESTNTINASETLFSQQTSIKQNENVSSTESDLHSEDELENTKPEDQSMRAEIKHLDKKLNENGHKVFLERQCNDKDDKRDWWGLFALCEVRHYYDSGDYRCTRLHVNSPPLKHLLEDVVGDYPNEPIDASSDVEIDLPAYCLFFYRKELEDEGRKRFAGNREGQTHLKLLLGYIDDVLEDEFRSFRRVVMSESKAINYDHLWTLFKPGCIVYLNFLGQPRAFRLLEFLYREGESAAFVLSVEFVDYDGDMFGTRTTDFRIPMYSGTMHCEQLNVKPLDLLPQSDSIRRLLIDRGRRFEKLVGQNYMHYSGLAVRKKERTYERFHLTGRVMIDCKTYHRLDPNDAFTVTELVRSEAAKRQRDIRKFNDGTGLEDFVEGKIQDELLDEDRLLANAAVRGFAFTHKRFLEFFVDNLAQIEWNSTSFEQLVLDPAPKRTVQALVSSHVRRAQGSAVAFDDIVKGKGTGLVLVLHGPPGVGKTLTAECVAESVRCPLYMVSSGDLGTDSTTLDEQLTRIMDITSTWRAVLLIDEADVFLERRTLHNMQRNSMVSVFLRVLEYYSGILFLTTNRVATFDDAFKSRIHVPLRYTHLSAESRRSIWRNFCLRVPGGTDIDDKGLDKLAKYNLNGRQIKNIIKTAESLASFEGTKLDLERLEDVTLIQAKFERDLLEATDASVDEV